jgi:hypothetical protein
MPYKGRTVVLTTFAGREANMRVQLRYVRHLLARGLLDEFHAWNFTRNAGDEAWLLKEVGRSHTWQCLPVPHGHAYAPAGGVLRPGGDGLKLRCAAESDAHLLLSDARGDVAELVLGAYGNSLFLVREARQGAPLLSMPYGLTAPGWNAVELSYDDGGVLRVAVEGLPALQVRLRRPEGPVRVSVAGMHAPCQWQLRRSDERIFHPHKDSWCDYYRHYTEARYPDSVVIKCDDDILYIDPEGFRRYLDYVVGAPAGAFLLAFPNIVNNGVVAHYQQHRMGLLPVDIFGDLPYDTFCGRLWGDGRLAAQLHRYFAEHREAFAEVARDLPAIEHPAGHRISINFFAVRSEDLDKVYAFCRAGGDDEHWLSVVAAEELRRPHAVHPSCFVAHGAFFRQRESGLDDEEVVRLYAAVADAVLGPEAAP